MTNIKLIRATQQNINDNKVPYKNGQFIITDAGNIYADFPTERVEFNSGGGTFLAVPDQTTYQEIIDAMDAGKNVQTFVTVEDISVCIPLFVISRHLKQCLFAGIIPTDGAIGAIGILVEEDENGETTWSNIENTQLATTNYVDDTIDTLIGDAPDLLNTLNELAAALNNDANFATTILQQLGNKVDKEPGKGLFSGSYEHLTDTPTIPTSLSQLKDDTEHRTVTDTKIKEWNDKSTFSGSYNDLDDKPTNLATTSDIERLGKGLDNMSSALGSFASNEELAAFREEVEEVYAKKANVNKYNTIIDKAIGTIYPSMPSDLDILYMKDGTYFTVEETHQYPGINTTSGEYTLTGPGTRTRTTYLKQAGWSPNAKRYSYESIFNTYKNSDNRLQGKTFESWKQEMRNNGFLQGGQYSYDTVIPIGQYLGEINVIEHGIKAGHRYAQQNSQTMKAIIEKYNHGITLNFPAGHFYFSEPLNFYTGGNSCASFNLIGDTNPARATAMISGGTWLHFDDLQPVNGIIPPAIETSQSMIANLAVVGATCFEGTFGEDENGSKNLLYHQKIYRGEYKEGDKIKQNIENVSVTIYERNGSGQISEVTTPIGISGTLIKNATNELTQHSIGIKFGGGVIRNVSIYNFYTGIYTPNTNAFLHNIRCGNCHYGASIGNDVKVFDLSVWDVSVGLQIRGSLASATGIRGDSVSSHLVELLGGGRITLTDLDSDFGLGSLIHIETGGGYGGKVENLVVNGVHGRAGAAYGVKYFSDIKTAQDEDITPGEIGVISLGEGAQLHGAIINTNQGAVIDPYDYTEGYAPYVLVTGASGSTIKNVQITCTAGYDTDDENTITNWVKDRINVKNGTAENIKINTSRGYAIYNAKDGEQTVTTNKADINNNIENVVKSINGISPDENGNITIETTEKEPIACKDYDSIPKGDEEDKTNRYILPDGSIWKWKGTFIKGGKIPNFINSLPNSLNPMDQSKKMSDTGFGELNYRYGTDDAKPGQFVERAPDDNMKNQGFYMSGLIPIAEGQTLYVNQINQGTWGSGYSYVTFFSDVPQSIGLYYGDNGSNLNLITDAGGTYTKTGGTLSNIRIPVNDITGGWVAKYSEIKWCSIITSTAIPLDEIIVTVDQEITWTETKDRYEWKLVQVGQNASGAQRPDSPILGQSFFDTNLKKPIWWNGTNWIDASGNAV